MRLLCWRAKADLVLFAVGLWVLDLGTGTPSTDRLSASPSARSTEEHFVHRHQGKLKTTKTHILEKWKLEKGPLNLFFSSPSFFEIIRLAFNDKYYLPRLQRGNNNRTGGESVQKRKLWLMNESEWNIMTRNSTMNDITLILIYCFKNRRSWLGKTKH